MIREAVVIVVLLIGLTGRPGEAQTGELRAGAGAMTGIGADGSPGKFVTTASFFVGFFARGGGWMIALSRALPGAKTEDRDYMFLNFVLRNLPNGIVGLILAVVFSAAMSSMASTMRRSASGHASCRSHAVIIGVHMS